MICLTWLLIIQIAIDNSGGLIDRLNNTADLEDIAATWQSIYESLQYGTSALPSPLTLTSHPFTSSSLLSPSLIVYIITGDEWEKFLKKDIVPLGMAQLTGLYILVPFGAIARYHLERKRERLRYLHIHSYAKR